MHWKLEVFNSKGLRISLITQAESLTNPRDRVETYFLLYVHSYIRSGLTYTLKVLEPNSDTWEEVVVGTNEILYPANLCT